MVAIVVVIAAVGAGVGYLVVSRGSGGTTPARSASPVATKGPSGGPTTASSTSQPAPTTQPPTTTAPPSSPTTAAPPGSGFDYQAAVATVNAHGYNVAGQQAESGYPGPLAVLIGTNANNGRGQQAFFFVDNRYIGTDTSIGDDVYVSVVYQTGTLVALSYPQFQSGDPRCCPSGGSSTVRYQWTGSTLQPLDPLSNDPNNYQAS